MLHSMTGFGSAKVELENKIIQIEIRTLNSKNADLNLRMPSLYRSAEPELRQLLSSKLKRGKIDVQFHVELSENANAQAFNFNLIEQYKSNLKKISPDATDGEILNTLMRLPNVLDTTKEELSDEEKQSILNVLYESIEKVNNYRADEGKHLVEEFNLRIQNILTLLDEIPKHEDKRIEKVKERIQSNLAELNTEVDKNRFEQELVYYLEKFDVSEEKQRLKTHCDYFIQVMNESDSNGKKLGFISQEIGREINTLGSKSNHHEMQKIVVQMKDELEKVKEQVLNVL